MNYYTKPMSTFHPAQKTSSLTEESPASDGVQRADQFLGFVRIYKHLIFSAVPDHSFLKIMISKGPGTISPSPLDNRVVSSANSSSALPSASSFIIRDSSSPRTDPCCTLYSTPRLPDTALFTDTTWHLQLRYVESICRTSPTIPYLHILSSSSSLTTSPKTVLTPQHLDFHDRLKKLGNSWNYSNS